LLPQADEIPQQEIQRLDLTHLLVTKVIGGVIYLAPIDGNKPIRILDAGTVTGICTTPPNRIPRSNTTSERDDC
jgi:hypothetical protein